MILYVEEYLGECQCGFRKEKSTIEHILDISQIIEKNNKFRKNLWQIFIDFKKVYGIIHRESLYNIMTEFGVPKKLKGLIMIFMEEIQYQIRVDQAFPETFKVETGLKQGYKLYPILFNVALEKLVREMHREATSMEINQQKI